MSSGVPRNHHWVPQCYLKGFSKSRSKNAQLHVIDAVVQRHFTTVPRNVASARDFNRVEIAGFDPNRVESDMAKFECMVDKALERICAANAIRNAMDFNLLLNLIALLAVRNPSMRENIRQVEEQSTKAFIARSMATSQDFDTVYEAAIRAGALSADDKLSYDEMRKFIDQDRYTIEVPTTQHVELEFELVDTILPLLGARRWRILRAGTGTGGFITSDHPVVLQWIQHASNTTPCSPGFGLRNTEVVFPVSHELAVVGTFSGRGGLEVASEHDVAWINGVIIAHGWRQIYARDDGFRYLARDGNVRHGINALRDLPKPPSKRTKT